MAASPGGLGLADLAGLFAEMFIRALGDLPDQDREREFADREVKLATTMGSAGVVHGDLTAECAAAVAAVLDALRSNHCPVIGKVWDGPLGRPKPAEGGWPTSQEARSYLDYRFR